MTRNVVSTWPAEWSLVAIIGNMMPPRDPTDGDDDNEDEDDEKPARRTGGRARTRRRVADPVCAS